MPTNNDILSEINNSDKLIVILTGAGISAESGIATFRDGGGLWAEHNVEDVATPEGYLADPELVHSFYNHRRRELLQAEPNSAHHALAKLESEFKGEVYIVTQNVDDLHSRAGTNNLYHMHGELLSLRCTKCGNTLHTKSDSSVNDVCENCETKGSLRPDIVWFGEMPLYMDTISDLLNRCDLFISIGTSGAVYPAAGFVQHASGNGKAHTVELNLERSQGASLFNEGVYGKATNIVPEYVDRVLSE